MDYKSVLKDTLHGFTSIEVTDHCAGDGKSKEYDQGWRDCYMKILDNYTILDKWYSNLTESQQDAWIVLRDECLITVEASKVHISLNMSDVFGYACADCEDFEISEIEELANLYKTFGFSGLKAWAGYKRGLKPLKIDSRYREALHLISRISHGRD